MHVLFVSYGGGHITMILPVIRALREQVPGVQVTLLALTTARAVALAAGESPLGYANFRHLVDEAFVSEWGTALASGNEHPAVSAEETEAYIGVNFWDLTRQHGLEAARARYGNDGRYSFFPIEFFRRVIGELRPDVAVSTNSPRSEHAAIDAAVQLGVPVLSMIDLFAMSFDPYLRRERHADRITVMVPQARDNLVAHGIEAGRVAITGNPAFDGLFAPELKEEATSLRRTLGWEGLKVVLFAGIVEQLHGDFGAIEPGTAFGEAVEGILRKWCARRTDVAVIVRFHPNEAHLFAVRGPQERVYVSRPVIDRLHPQILAADVVLVTGSTVGVEAASAGVPVLSLESAGSASLMSYAKLGISKGVPRLAELEAYLDAAVDGPAQGARTALQTGPAAPRIAAEIHRLATQA